MVHISNGDTHAYDARSRWDRWSKRLEVTVGELLPDQPLPLLKRRLELSREEALKPRNEKRKLGWQFTTPQWRPPQVAAQD